MIGVLSISFLLILSLLVDLSNVFETTFVSEDESHENTAAIYILQLYSHAKYAWDRLQRRKDTYSPIKTGFYYSTEITNRRDYPLVNNLELLQVCYAMYKITNDTLFLQEAKTLFLSILEYNLAKITIENKLYAVFHNYNWEEDVLFNSTFSPINLYVPLAIEDPYFVSYFETLLSTNHEIFWSPKNLVYQSRDKNEKSYYF